jgi:hypothetical protein
MHNHICKQTKKINPTEFSTSALKFLFPYFPRQRTHMPLPSPSKAQAIQEKSIGKGLVAHTPHYHKERAFDNIKQRTEPSTRPCPFPSPIHFHLIHLSILDIIIIIVIVIVIIKSIHRTKNPHQNAHSNSRKKKPPGISYVPQSAPAPTFAIHASGIRDQKRPWPIGEARVRKPEGTFEQGKTALCQPALPISCLGYVRPH